MVPPPCLNAELKRIIMVAEAPLWQDLFAEVKRYFDHKKKLSSYSGPLLVMHTENDGMIDISHAERINK